MNRLAKSFLHIAVWLAIAVFPVASFGADGSSLKPPPGARVAIVVFEDLECPSCATAYPMVWEAAKAHNVPVMLRDFPLEKHPWSFEAAVFARYFDSKSQKLGEDFRGYIYKNQTQIDKQNLRQYVDKFASDNKAPVPFVLDPDGQFKAKIIADRTLGTQIGLQHTPTIFVIGNGGAATPPIEIDDYSKIGQAVEDMLQKAPAAAPAKKTAPKKATTKKTAKK
ncbi:MAG TPA: thioredoxin domain-containing protein [Candidatus Angelobacter sp.]|jgi:protein-disulfide isomerase|nr:thioredoxin domain-containing protein [Candidatus Angelobacter sp.]